MDVHELRKKLFELGEALQDIYIAREAGRHRETGALREKLREALQFMRREKCTLELVVEYRYRAGSGRERLFETDTLWEDLDEVEHTAHLKISLTIDESSSPPGIRKGTIEGAYYLEQDVDEEDDEGEDEPEAAPSPPRGERLVSEEDTRKLLRDIGIELPEDK